MKRRKLTDEPQLTSISKARTLEEIGEFWDTHSIADYWEQTYEVEFEVRAQRRQPTAPTSEDLRLTEAETAELDRRIAACEQNPAEGMTWKKFKRQFRTKP